MKRFFSVLLVLLIPLAVQAESMTVTVSPTYDNPPFRVGGVNISFKKYDMQRYREGNEWNWTINYCEVYANGNLAAKIVSEEMEAGKVFTFRAGDRVLHITIKEMPKVNRQMECRGPVQPCWTKSEPVTRAKYIMLDLETTPGS